MTTNIFEKASRLKLRFKTPVGELPVERLWDLNLESKGNEVSLDSIAIELDSLIKEQKTVSFVKSSTRKTKVQIENQLRFDIVLYIIETKSNEEKISSAKNEARQEMATLQEEKRRREHESLLNGSDAEIEKRLEELSKVVNS